MPVHTGRTTKQAEDQVVTFPESAARREWWGKKISRGRAERGWGKGYRTVGSKSQGSLRRWQTLQSVRREPINLEQSL